MKKKTEIIILTLLIIIGSLVTFFATNLLMSDLSNMFYGVHDYYIISSLPTFFIALDFTIALIFVIRYARYSQYRKSLIKLYTIYGIVNSSLGLIFSILTGTIVYHNYLAGYPFFAYPLITTILHSLLIIAGILILLKVVKKMPNDLSKRRIKWYYCLYSAVLGAMTFFSFNKFGAFIYAPFYIYWRTLNITFTFYLSLLMPIALVIHVIIYMLDGYKGREKDSIIVTSVILGLSIILCTSVLILGSTHTQFISAVSPALPLERLGTKPYNSIFMLIGMIVFRTYYLIYAIRSYKRAKA